MQGHAVARAFWLITTIATVQAAVVPDILVDAVNETIDGMVNQVLGQTMKLEQVDMGKYLKSGPIQLMKTFDKYAPYGAVAPKDVKTAAAAARQKGSVAAIPQTFDSYYLTPVTLGGKVVHLDIDTGSADLWAFSSRMPEDERGNHAYYQTSSGERIRGGRWSVHYGDGSGASGLVYVDRVVVGGVTATSQAVEAATSVSESFVNSPGEGIMGLAFSQLNQVFVYGLPTFEPNFFDTVKDGLAAKLFTADLRKSRPGTYTFGYIPSGSGPITYVPVDSSSGFWAFTPGQYTVGANRASGMISGNSIVDTGTSLLCLPDAVVKAYWQQVSSARYDTTQGGYVFRCSERLPDFAIQLGGEAFKVPGVLINYAPVDGTNCFGGIQSNNGAPFSIFGDVFLKAVLAVFDQTENSPRLGFASKSV